MKNFLLTISYDGSQYSGWQRQPHVPTVQGKLEEILSILCKEKIEIAGTSRTDAGVHAYGQRATLRGSFSIPGDRLVIAANNLLGGKKNGPCGDIRIIDIEEKEEGFHARFDAKGKKYIYKIHSSREPDLFRRFYCYHLAESLDVKLMRQMAETFTGEHDFRCFMAAGGKEPDSTVRFIKSITIDEKPLSSGDGRDITITVEGNSFLYNMVRILTGTLVEAGLGKRRPEEGHRIIEGKDRRLAGHTAPPFGLYLAQVYFDEGWRAE